MFSIRFSTPSIGCFFDFHPDINNTPLGAITVKIFYKSDKHSEMGGPFFIGTITSQECWGRRVRAARCYQDYLLLNAIEQYKKELDSALSIMQKSDRSIAVQALHELTMLLIHFSMLSNRLNEAKNLILSSPQLKETKVVSSHTNEIKIKSEVTVNSAPKKQKGSNPIKNSYITPDEDKAKRFFLNPAMRRYTGDSTLKQVYQEFVRIPISYVDNGYSAGKPGEIDYVKYRVNKFKWGLICSYLTDLHQEDYLTNKITYGFFVDFQKWASKQKSTNKKCLYSDQFISDASDLLLSIYRFATISRTA